jgi:predicted nucleic acid-binding Zn ribbon protein
MGLAMINRSTQSKIKNQKSKTEKGPELLGEVLGRLFTARGWGRRQEQLRLEVAWAEAIGEEGAQHTGVVGLRRGVFEVEVDNATLLAELVQFHKRKLLEQVRKRLPSVTINDLRFRAGTAKKDRK